MERSDSAKAWADYREAEFIRLDPILARLGYTLDEEQVHTQGERFLMAGAQDVGGGGRKLVLMGKRKADGLPVVIKASSEAGGIREIETERQARQTLATLPFAYRTLRVPDELWYGNQEGVRLFITEFIAQDQPFLARPLIEQFALALDTFKAQESVHATTSSHARSIRSVFGMKRASDYLDSFACFKNDALANDPENAELADTFARAETYLQAHAGTLEQYADFLTHADFVPHNLRVRNGEVYLLDCASLHFGNKYESWARFLNFMLLYNRPLEEALVTYVKENRTPEESESLRLLRIYKLGKLLEYHAGTLPRTEGDLNALGVRRVAFWRQVLESILTEKSLSDELITAYKADRDTLRSGDEKKRQESLH
jgi:hypothetical protein